MRLRGKAGKKTATLNQDDKTEDAMAVVMADLKKRENFSNKFNLDWQKMIADRDWNFSSTSVNVNMLVVDPTEWRFKTISPSGEHDVTVMSVLNVATNSELIFSVVKYEPPGAAEVSALVLYAVRVGDSKFDNSKPHGTYADIEGKFTALLKMAAEMGAKYELFGAGSMIPLAILLRKIWRTNADREVYKTLGRSMPDLVYLSLFLSKKGLAARNNRLDVYAGENRKNGLEMSPTAEQQTEADGHLEKEISAGSSNADFYLYEWTVLE